MREECEGKSRPPSLLGGCLFPTVVGIENAVKQFPLFPSRVGKMRVSNMVLQQRRTG